MSITYNLIINQLTSDSLHFGFKKILDAVMHCLLLKKSLSVLLKMVGKFTVLFLMHLKRLIKCYIMDFLLNFYKKEYLLSLCVFYRIGVTNFMLQYCGMDC